MSIERYKQLVRLYLKAIETEDLSIFDDIIHPAYSLRVDEMASTTRELISEIAKGTGVIGIQGIKERMTIFFQKWGDTSFHIIDLIGEGETVIAYFQIEYTMQGDILGIKSTGKRVKAKGFFTFKFIDEKIIHVHMLQDFFNIIKQIGLEFYENEEQVVHEYLEAIKKNMYFEI